MNFYITQYFFIYTKITIYSCLEKIAGIRWS